MPRETTPFPNWVCAVVTANCVCVCRVLPCNCNSWPSGGELALFEHLLCNQCFHKHPLSPDLSHLYQSGGTGSGRSGNLGKVTWLQIDGDPIGTHPYCISRGRGKKKKDSGVKGKFFPFCSRLYFVSPYTHPPGLCHWLWSVYVYGVCGSVRPWDRHYPKKINSL